MHADAAFGRLCSPEAVDTSSWPPAVGGNSHQPWVMSPAGAPAVGSLATERFAAKLILGRNTSQQAKRACIDCNQP